MYFLYNYRPTFELIIIFEFWTDIFSISVSSVPIPFIENTLFFPDQPLSICRQNYAHIFVGLFPDFQICSTALYLLLFYSLIYYN